MERSSFEGRRTSRAEPMNFTQFRQSIGRLKARFFGLALAGQEYGQQEIDELATAISEYGRMRQQHDGSRSVLLGAGELAMRLRETTHTVVKALGVLRDQGRAEETSTDGRWRLLFSVPGKQEPDTAMRKLPDAEELRR